MLVHFFNFKKYIKFYDIGKSITFIKNGCQLCTSSSRSAVVSLDPGYWQELGKRKLEEYQLREDPVTIRGSYSNYRNISTPFLSLDYTAFDVGYQPTGLDLPSPGLLRNMNTIASFNNIDKKECLDTCGPLILESIKNGDCLKNPSLLMSFLLLMYADLKKCRFNYWFGFPALSPSSPFTYISISRLDTLFKDSDLQHLVSRYNDFQSEHKSVGFFEKVLN